MKHSIVMTFTKSTKGTHVYSSPDDTDAVKTVYIDRSDLPSTPPKQITLTLDWDDE